MAESLSSTVGLESKSQQVWFRQGAGPLVFVLLPAKWDQYTQDFCEDKAGKCK